MMCSPHGEFSEQTLRPISGKRGSSLGLKQCAHCVAASYSGQLMQHLVLPGGKSDKDRADVPGVVSRTSGGTLQSGLTTPGSSLMSVPRPAMFVAMVTLPSIC